MIFYPKFNMMDAWVCKSVHFYFINSTSKSNQYYAEWAIIYGCNVEISTLYKVIVTSWI